MSPAWQQKPLRQFCKVNGIHITAYSPLGAPGTKWGDSRVLNSDVLHHIAKAKGKTVAQVMIIFTNKITKYVQGSFLDTPI